MNWRALAVAPQGNHHVGADGAPAYRRRFDSVLKFHAPGLAPVSVKGGAWHIRPDGSDAYARRFGRTFGFYGGLAAVVGPDGWHHIHPDGTDAYAERHDWCGNVQDGRCTVRGADGQYLHIGLDGRPLYAERWAYAGDYRDGVAVVQAVDGRSTHIDGVGRPIHDRWFDDLDVFHKGFARARDARGWHHIDRQGRPIHARRFTAAEPFYNGQARVDCLDGAREVIDEAGRTRTILRSLAGPAEPADALARDGFVCVPGVLGPSTRQALVDAIAEILDRPDAGHAGDILRMADGRPRKLLYPLGKHRAFLLALAEPAILELALQLCPDPTDIVLTWEDVLLKPPRVGLAVPPHQDIALQSVGGGVFSLGVHLHDAAENPLLFVPGSHVNGPLTRDEVRALVDTDEWVTVRPAAGDVLAHDVLVVHRSDPNRAASPRTTWYLEFRTRAALYRDGPWDTRWIADRRALLFHAVAAREAAGLPVVWPPCASGESREDWLAHPLTLRVPHITSGVRYDLDSPYHHFA